jgi:hypothetical protein
MEYHAQQDSAHRNFRAAVLNGRTPDPKDSARLEARGINTSELEYRLRQSTEFKH